MTPESPSWLDQLILYIGLFAAWVSGEAGRAVLAGAAGGLIRWLMSETRRLRDGAVSIVAGVLFAKYGTPIVLALLELWLGNLGRGTDVRDAAAFAAGIIGMSLSKIILGIADAQAARIGRGGGNAPEA